MADVSIKAEIGRALAGLLSSRSGGENGDFVQSSSGIWHQEALGKRVLEEFSRSEQDRDRLDVVVLSDMLGINPVAVRSAPALGLVVADGVVFHLERLRGRIQARVKEHVEAQGYCDVPELCRLMELHSEAVRELVSREVERSGAPSKREFQLEKEKKALHKAMSEATMAVVPIPSELRSYAAQLCKSDAALKGGHLINLGSEFEPKDLRSKKAEGLKLRLFLTESEVRTYVGEDSVKHLTEITSVSPKVFCWNANIDALATFISDNIQEQGVCSVDDVIAYLKLKVVPGEPEPSIQTILAMVEQQSKKALFTLKSNRFIFAAADLDRLLKTQDVSFCKIEEAQRYLKDMLSSIQNQVVPAKEPAKVQTETLFLENKSRTDLEQIFIAELWPELSLYVQAATKLRRTAIGPYLNNALIEGSLCPKGRIIQVLKGLLRIELQLGKQEDLPEAEIANHLKDLLEMQDSAEKLLKQVQATASSHFGLPCVPLDKKLEKDHVNRLRLAWTKNDIDTVGVRQKWLHLVQLAVLHTWKLVIYIDPESFGQETFEALKGIVNLPEAFVLAAETWLSSPSYEIDDDDEHASFRQALIDILTNDLEKGFLAQCVKVK